MHTIRLRAPWQSAWHRDASTEQWVAAYTRPFHRPSGLAGAAVHLRYAAHREAIHCGVAVELNECRLEPLPSPVKEGNATEGDVVDLNAADCVLSFDVTQSLKPYNTLKLLLPALESPSDSADATLADAAPGTGATAEPLREPMPLERLAEVSLQIFD